MCEQDRETESKIREREREMLSMNEREICVCFVFVCSYSLFSNGIWFLKCYPYCFASEFLDVGN